MDKRKLIIDTDCGSDDAMAIAMALNDPRYEILFFTIVTGNVRMRQAAVNTLTTIEASGTYAPPVYLGCNDPLINPYAGSTDTHGTDGMGDLGFAPKRLKPAAGNAVLRMIEALDAHADGEIEIIALGPLTNLALAIRLAPESMKKVRRISIMGTSGLGPGNVSAVAEFNIWQDAEAARIVFESGLPLLAVGWDACCGDAMLSPAEMEQIRAASPLGRFAVDCNRTLAELNVARFGCRCLDMADPAAMAAALEPSCIDVCDDYYCVIDTTPGPSYGAALVDIINFGGKKPTAAICSRLKPDRFKAYLMQTLAGTFAG
ncbi:MAG: nucleoside hydrolase [Oscillospiraceae bacterium]|nr:nucleoside hydrolase [Oscillospiraceae bacterium]